MYLTRIWWIHCKEWITLVVYFTLLQFTLCVANFSIAGVTAADITKRSVMAGVLTWVWATLVNCIYKMQLDSSSIICKWKILKSQSEPGNQEWNVKCVVDVQNLRLVSYGKTIILSCQKTCLRTNILWLLLVSKITLI